MKIIFYGQLGLPRLNQTNTTSRASRVEALARLAVQDGHSVTVLGTSPYLSIGNFHGIELHPVLSLNPEKPGGWVYLILGLLHVLLKQPDTIHVHDNRAALLLALTRFLFRDTQIVWTIDEVPLPKLLTIRQHGGPAVLAGQLQANLTTPSRTLQYRLLTQYDIKAAYVPDGYEEPTVPDMAMSHFGLKKGQYSVALGTSDGALRHIKKAYKSAKTRKQLVILKQTTPRAVRSLINGAAVVIIGDNSVPTNLLLEAMHGSRAIIAPTVAAYQEILGTAGQYVAKDDAAGLTAALNNVVTNPTAQAAWGAKAHTRATHHFTWPRLMEDYQTLYVPHVRLVPLDSAHTISPDTNPRLA